MQGPSNWHQCIFQLAIAILLCRRAPQRYVNRGFESQLNSIAQPCLLRHETLANKLLEDITDAAEKIAQQPKAQLPKSEFVRHQGAVKEADAPPQSVELARRASEDYERGLCENRAIEMLQNPREVGENLINQEGREMIVAMAFGRPLADAQRLVESPKAFIKEILQTVETAKSHPVISEMLKPDVHKILLPTVLAPEVAKDFA